MRYFADMLEILITHNNIKILMYKSFKSQTIFNGLTKMKSNTPCSQNMIQIYEDINPAVKKIKATSRSLFLVSNLW